MGIPSLESRTPRDDVMYRVFPLYSRNVPNRQLAVTAPSHMTKPSTAFRNSKSNIQMSQSLSTGFLTKYSEN